VESQLQGLIAGRYRLQGLIGRGGMGEVHAAHDERLDRPVAVKLLRPDLAADGRARQRFEHEARAAAAVEHPHVVTIYDTGEDDVPFIVMERLPGETLADEIADGPLTPRRLELVARETLDALGAAHQRGILHRDVKPGNVLITADRHVKVGDFGIAKAIEARGDTTGLVVGTIAYTAPERLAGAPASPASDLYSVGVVLYEAATGTKPFARDSAAATMHAIDHDAPPALGPARPDLSPNFVAGVERALARYPRARYLSAAEMAAALLNPSGAGAQPLDQTVADRGSPTTLAFPAVVAAPRHRRWRSLRRSRVVIAAVLGVATLAIVAGFLFGARHNDGPATPAATTNPTVVVAPTPTTPLTAPPTTPPTSPPPHGNHGNGKGDQGDQG
jgi:serine/threonine-protein kinase